MADVIYTIQGQGHTQLRYAGDDDLHGVLSESSSAQNQTVFGQEQTHWQHAGDTYFNLELEDGLTIQHVERMLASAKSKADCKTDVEALETESLTKQLHAKKFGEGLQATQQERLAIQAESKQLGLEEETEEREREMEGVDAVDLPSSDDEICRFEQEEESNWDPGEEEEKACSDRTSNATNSCHRFSRVYDVDSFEGKIHVPKKLKPVHGSPSAHIKKDPFLMSGPIQSTRRIRVTFKDKLDKSQKILHGTAFSLSPKVGCSARHCLFKDGMDVSAIDICEGSHVSYRTFDSAGYEGTLVGVSTQQFSKAKDSEGLFISGADVGMFSINKGTFESFLLPCSPSFLLVSQRNKVAIPSYPGVESMLQKAKEDLKKSNTSATWKAYKPAMEKDIIAEFQKLAALPEMKGKSKNQIMRAVLKKIKQVLYDDLVETFHGFSNGDMLCAVGSVTAWNDVSIANSCSTLRGSSGGPLCVFGLAEYFFGVHSGGICGFDQNGATSCDNPEFVKMYMGHVLPTLPKVRSQIWKNIDMRGFIHWLNLHIAEIPQDSPWLAKAL